MASLVTAQQGSTTAAEFFNLANLHSNYGRYQEAESALNQALRICEETGDDAMAARAWNSLGELNRMRGRYAEAEPAYTRAKVILESNRGDPSDLPAVLNNLGAVYRLTGRYSDAEKVIQSALAIWESDLGREHLNTASTSYSLRDITGFRFNTDGHPKIDRLGKHLEPGWR